MAQHEKDPATDGHGALAPHVEPQTVPAEAQARSDDEAIFAPIENPSVEAEPDAQENESSAVEPSAPVAAAPQPAPSRRKKNRQILTFTVATLGLAATAGAIGAYTFRDRHEKLAAVAALIDESFAQPEKLIEAVRKTSVEWLGDAARRPSKTEPEPEPVAAPPSRAEPEIKAPAESVAEKETPGVKAQGSGERITWSAPPPPASVDPVVPAAPAAPAGPASARSDRAEQEIKAPAESVAEKEAPEAKAQGSGKRIAAAPAPTAPAPLPPPGAAIAEAADESRISALEEALGKRVEQIEQVAQSALKAAEEARSEAARAAAATEATPEPQDRLLALQSRIDELAAELRGLAEKLEAPKAETRLPREDAVDSAKPGSPAVVVVLAHSLQKALERGAPFASEYAALAAQDVDSDALAALAPSAESGAPTLRQLLSEFKPVAKQIEAASAPKAGAPIGDRLLHGVTKLVKVRPAGDKPVSTVPEIVAKIDAALDRGDAGAAKRAFDELPQAERNVARAWGEALQRRIDAEAAATTILSNAIAALGKSKS
jgi:hypothetical protein